MELFCNLLYGAIRMRDEDQWIETVFSIKLFYIDFFLAMARAIQHNSSTSTVCTASVVVQEYTFHEDIGCLSADATVSCIFTINNDTISPIK